MPEGKTPTTTVRGRECADALPQRTAAELEQACRVMRRRALKGDWPPYVPMQHIELLRQLKEARKREANP